MSAHRKLAPVALVAALALGGCVSHASVGLRLGAPVVVARGHVHDVRCGHYTYRGRWYHAPGHHHGPRCGHVHRGGVWIRVR